MQSLAYQIYSKVLYLSLKLKTKNCFAIHVKVSQTSTSLCFHPDIIHLGVLATLLCKILHKEKMLKLSFITKYSQYYILWHKKTKYKSPISCFTSVLFLSYFSFSRLFGVDQEQQGEGTEGLEITTPAQAFPSYAATAALHTSGPVTATLTG